MANRPLLIFNFCRQPLSSLNSLHTPKFHFTQGVRTIKSTSAGRDPKPRVVVLGTGWSSVFFVKNLSPKRFDLTVVSPRNFFTFTPLLPKVFSGLVSGNTAAEPIVPFMQRNFKGRSRFVHAKCVDVDSDAKQLTCVPVGQDSPTFSVPYDYLVVAVGATSNTFGTPGADEHALFLKEVEHAELGYQKILENVRKASMPFVSEDEKRSLLHFVVVGGGPTGVETTGELAELINGDFKRTYPKLYPYFKLSIVEGGPRLLPTLAQKTSDYVARVFMGSNVHTHFGKAVCEVKPDAVVMKNRDTGETEELKCGLVLWASGLKENELVVTLKKRWKLPENVRALWVDQFMRARGVEDVFCLGDCCKLVPAKLADNAEAVIEAIGAPSVGALVKNRKKLARDFPQLRESKWDFRAEKFKVAAAEIVAKHGGESCEAFAEILAHIDAGYVPPFPTAQNAKQQALYLSKMFNNGSALANTFKEPAFSEVWKGTLASLGGLTVVANTPVVNLHGGPLPYLMWNGIYLTMFSSCRMRASFVFDMLTNLCGTRHMLSKRSGEK